MDEIRKQVARAQWRLNLQRFVVIASWSLFAAILVSLIGVAIPKIWVLTLPEDAWRLSWGIGAAIVGLGVSVLLTYFMSRSRMEAAIELDRRFGLKERVSSSLALSSSELQSEVGQALVRDAVRRVERVDVREHFRLKAGWRPLLPLVAATAWGLIAFLIPSAHSKASATTAISREAAKKAAEQAAEKIIKKLEERRKLAEEKGLTDAESALKELKQGAEKLKQDKGESRKEVLVKINNVAQDLEKRREQLGGADQLKKKFDQLKNLEKGPADKMAEAMKDGDFNKAAQELNKLKDKLAKGEMSKEDREKLSKQLEDFKKSIDEFTKEREEKKQRLEQEIAEKRAQGDLAAAGKLQQQLDAMKSQDAQMQKMAQQMSEQLSEAAKQLAQGGDGQKAMEQLSKFSDSLKEMASQMNEMESLDDVLDQLSDAKEAMNCKECNGKGCPSCQGKSGKGQNGQGMSQQGNQRGVGKMPGRGLGKGRGQGDRPEEETDVNFIDSKVNSKLQKGQSTRIGDASGPNAAGRATEEVQSQIRQSLESKDSDPLTDQALPRDQREHAKQYFERLRKGA